MLMCVCVLWQCSWGHVLHSRLCLWRCALTGSSLDVCTSVCECLFAQVWMCAHVHHHHYMLTSHQGHLYTATLYSTVSDPHAWPLVAPLFSTLFLIQNKWSQERTGRRWEGWREGGELGGWRGVTKKKAKKKIQSIITLAKHQELKKREGEEEKKVYGQIHLPPCYNQSLAKRNTQ